MESFGENYQAGNTPDICPLCKLRYDNQELSLLCPEIKKEIIVRGDIKEIYKDNIEDNIIDTLTKIMEVRKQKLGNDVKSRWKNLCDQAAVHLGGSHACTYNIYAFVKVVFVP